MITATDFDFDALWAALQTARKSHLTLCIATDGGWACEPAETRLDNQLCRASENYSRAGLEAFVRESIDALNESRA